MERNYIKFLLVDDAYATRKHLRSIVEDLIYVEVDEAANRQEAKLQIENSVKQRNYFHVIFLDINMPEMNGMQFLEWLNQFEGLSKMPFVVMITAEKDSRLIFESIENGALDFIQKPFEVKRVKEVLKKNQTRYQV